MKRLLIAIVFLAVTGSAFAQNGACLIVKHKGTVGRRLIWFALIGVPIAPGASYDYVDAVGYAPEKMSYKGKELQKLGVRVIVLEKPTADNILSARQSCSPVMPAPPAAVVSASVSAPVGVRETPQEADDRADHDRAVVPTAPEAPVQTDSLADAARRSRQRHACLKLAVDNPGIVCK